MKSTSNLIIVNTCENICGKLMGDNMVGDNMMGGNMVGDS